MLLGVSSGKNKNSKATNAKSCLNLSDLNVKETKVT